MRTVGEILKKARLEKHFTLEDMEKTLRIRKKFLQALEENRWTDLPSLPYIKGFLKNYSTQLGLAPEEMLAVFRRQFSEKEVQDLVPKPATKTSSRAIPLRITPQIIVVTLVTFFLTLFLGYLIYQYRSFTGPPTLTLEKPAEGAVVKEKQIVVKGRTDSDTLVTINQQKTATDDEGTFESTLTLSPGINTITIESVKKNGKKRTITRTVSYEESGN
jgi:cytoskeletal protein RodZ